MSFLAPWFVLAGVAAIALPVLFHFFRRTPRGKLPFSTLMFLTPSPPRLTRRNRLENWPLLAMRALVFLLLALGFGRPFWRQILEQYRASPAGKQCVILLDTSGSMRRGDLWSQALQAVEQRLEQLGPHDELALLTFDHEVHSLLSFEAWRAAPVGERVALAKSCLAQSQLSWSQTRLDEALLASVEQLEAAQQRTSSQTHEQRIVVVSDLQQGSQLAKLQNYEWPKRIPVECVTLRVEQANAGLHPLALADENASAKKLKVLVTNAPRANRETFEMAWKTASESQPSIQVYVPPGQTRVVTTPALPEGENPELVLRGDDEPFDNTVWFVPPRREQMRVLYLSTEPANNPQTMRYFLERALGSPTANRVITVETISPHDEAVRVPREAEWADVPLIVLGTDRPLPKAWQAVSNAWLEQGGVVLAVLTQAESQSWQPFLPEDWAVTEHVRVTEHDANREYALLGELDLRHALLAPLNDPRFSDFTEIRFWKHRRVQLDETAQAHWRIVAKFDTGDPAILEAQRGHGRFIVFASGWQPKESQLGVSSKFVPLLTTLVEMGWRHPPLTASYSAGDRVHLLQLGHKNQPNTDQSISDTNSISSAGPWKIITPQGATIAVPADQPEYIFSAGPGVYELQSTTVHQRVAVNMPAEESKTEPLGLEALEALGIPLWQPTNQQVAVSKQAKEQLQSRALESRQQLWRWCLVFALLAIVGETWYAGKVARQQESVTM